MLQQASIGGDLNCSAANVASLKKEAVSAQGMTVAGTVWLSDGFESKGQVDLQLVSIHRDLRCTHAHFNSSAPQVPIGLDEPTVNGDGLKIEGDAYFDDRFDAQGIVNLSNARVTGQFVWQAAVPTQTTVLRMRSTKVGVIKDDVKSWPQIADSLELEGFAYDRIDGDTDIDLRKSWLARSKFSSQSYQQMADVFRRGGMTVEATQILVASEEKRGDKLSHKWSTDRLWHNLSGPLMAYGYRPLRACGLAALIVIAGSVVFSIGYRMNCIKSIASIGSKGSSHAVRRSPTYPQFCAIVYSLDVFLPVIRLFQKDNWVPVVRAPIYHYRPISTNRLTRALWLAGRRIPDAKWLFSHCVRLWHWAQIVVGWVITTLVVAGLAGLIRT
jgi:hypothetical protein